MLRGCSQHARVAVLATALVACGRDDGPRPRSELEAAIDAELHRRFGVTARTRCLGIFPGCHARLPDGALLPIAVTALANGGWEWQVDGMVIESAPVEAYLRDELAAMGAAQDATCGPPIRRVVAGERLECALANGGTAFVTIRADGSTAFELELDPIAARIRSEPLTAAHEEALTRASRALEAAEASAADGEDEGPPPAEAGDPR